VYLQAADYCHLSVQTDKQTDYLSQFPAPVMSVQTAATVKLQWEFCRQTFWHVNYSKAGNLRMT